MKKDSDFIATIYDPSLYLFLQPIRIAVMKELEKYRSNSILDLCCGTGSQLKLLNKNGFKDLHGVDLSKTMLNIVKKGNTSIKTYNKDATRTGFRNGSFDIAIISFALHEKDRKTQKRLIKESRRIIKDGGLLLIVDYAFDKKTIKIGKIGMYIIERFAGKEHYRNFVNYIDNHGLKCLMDTDEFKIVRQEKMLFKGVAISIFERRSSKETSVGSST